MSKQYEMNYIVALRYRKKSEKPKELIGFVSDVNIETEHEMITTNLYLDKNKIEAMRCTIEKAKAIARGINAFKGSEMKAKVVEHVIPPLAKEDMDKVAGAMNSVTPEGLPR